MVLITKLLKEPSTRRQKLDTTLTIIMIGLVVVILFIILRKDTKLDPNAAWKFQVDALKKDTARSNEEVRFWKSEKVKSDSVSAELIRNITEVNKNITSSRDRQTIIIKDHDEIPNTVNRYSTDRLYREFVSPTDQ